MQPKNAFQRKVVELKKKLKPVTEQQINWAFEHCFDKVGTQTKNNAACFECGHSWKQPSTLLVTLGDCECPSCGKELKLNVTAKKKRHDTEYFAILTTVSEFQVVRMIYLTKSCRIGMPPQITSSEVMQHWIDGEGKTAVFAKHVNGFSNCYDAWALWSDLELRGTVSYSSALRNSIRPFRIYPKRKILDTIKRNGFKGHFYDISPINLFKMILTDSKAETLIKSNQTSLLKYYYDHRSYSDPIDKYWRSVKICIRNNYIVKDASIWVDYLDLLLFFHKDLLSSHYVCPVDLKGSHDKLMVKKRQIDEAARLERDAQNRFLQAERAEKARLLLEKAHTKYPEEKGRFFGLSFTDGKLTVKVLESVEEFRQEGAVLEHCVFTNGYYNKSDSLVLSARIDDKPIETIEISLSSLKILQARGWDNKPTEFHNDIIKLVNSNLNKISRLIG